MFCTIKDFSEEIKIGIQTHGYEEVKSGENLLISIGVLGRCSNSSQNKYKVYIDNILILSSTNNEEQQEQQQDPFINAVETEIEDRIIYPKELEMDLSPTELLRLENHLFLIKQINEKEYLYYDNQNNIRVGENIDEIDNKTEISESSNYKELADEEMNAEPETYTYNAGYPPRKAFNQYEDKGQSYISRGKVRPLEPVIEFQY